VRRVSIDIYKINQKVEKHEKENTIRLLLKLLQSCSFTID
jgi:hypothetical protein